MKKINISDITLKKLAGERKVNLLFREKSAVANCADIIGVDAVEIGAGGYPGKAHLDPKEYLANPGKAEELKALLKKCDIIK
mgnify:CR=1 FL=1